MCHVVLELPVEKRVPRLKGPHTPTELVCPKASGCSTGSSFPSQAWGEGEAAGMPSSGFGSRRLRDVFSSQLGTARFSSRQLDPRSGFRIRDRLEARSGASQKARGLYRRPLSFGGERAGRQAPEAFPAAGVGYNGSL